MSSGAIAKAAASRYSSFDSQSSTSSSIDLKPSSKLKSFRKNSPATSNGASRTNTTDAIVKANKVRNDQNFASMVKKFMEKRSISKTKTTTDRQLPLIVPADFIAEDLKRSARKASNLTTLPKKLFGKIGGSTEKNAKALTEVKTNTRTLAMVLRSERELLSLNKDHQTHIAQLEASLEDRNQEVEKLKDLCLKQRAEIKALKSAILFPDEMNSQLQVLLDQQGSELKQARQVIPSLQRQISSLTGQLQSLSEDLAEVKAVKYTDGKFNSPVFNQEEAANSLDFSSDDDPATPDSPDDMLLKDMNPCLTPCYSKMKSKDYGTTSHDCPDNEEAYEGYLKGRKLSQSSQRHTGLRAGSSTTRAHAAFCRSDESKYRYGKGMGNQVL
ncbi:hypothetical protein Cgig2_005365 [Carnegiea gigantea]|uniref:Uncharacterized protein n=1 Tax=Carnegiea gigantea TaxID=171969 RepID=A0A9Q1K697_9CARY|nr:hypothetical protein Cgig2_005365 [Carnegiea gigantea]